MLKNKPRKIVDQWGDLCTLLRVYKLVAIGFGFLSFMLTGVVLIKDFKGPVVITRIGDSESYSLGKFKKVELSEKSIEGVARRFVHRRYHWEEVDSEFISENLRPYLTEGLFKKVKRGIFQLKEKDLKNKSVKQSVFDLKIEVRKNEVYCKFDKVLKIEGISLPIPTEIVLRLEKGIPTEFNPEGLYVSGLLERKAEG